MDKCDELRLKDARERDIALIQTSCERANMGRFLSRFYPTDGDKVWRWKMIFVGNKAIGNVWLCRTESLQELSLGIVIWEESYTGHGVGGRVIELLLDEVLHSKEAFSRLTLKVRENNHRAIHCYEKAGFLKTGHGIKEIDSRLIPYFTMERRF